MKDNDLFVVGIGASAGGIQPIFEFFSAIQNNTGAAFVVVQHLKRDYKSIMPELIARYTSLPIHTIVSGQMLEPNNIYLMPENVKVSIKDGHLFLKPRGINENVNYAIDEFFISLASEFKKKAIGIIFSGMGTDGTKGAIALEKTGGIMMVQHPESSQFDGMPNSAIVNDHPDYIIFPKEMPAKIMEFIKNNDRDKAKNAVVKEPLV